VTGTHMPPPATGGTGGGTPAPPIGAVQFNDGGVLGGSAAFTCNKITKCLAMGVGSSIDTPDAESCAAIGEDCHIG
jgi:hypothetical protein